MSQTKKARNKVNAKRSGKDDWVFRIGLSLSVALLLLGLFFWGTDQLGEKRARQSIASDDVNPDADATNSDYSSKLDIQNEILESSEPSNEALSELLPEVTLGEEDDEFEIFNTGLGGANWDQYDPDKSNAALQAGNALLAEKRYEAAIVKYLEASKFDPEDPDPLFNIGLAQAKLGKHQEAVDSYSKSLNIFSDYPEALNMKGNSQLAMNQTESAIQSYEKALELAPDYPLAWNNLGKALAQDGKIAQAIQKFSKALELNENYVEARHNMGRAYMTMGRHQEALAQFNIILQKYPNFEPTRRAFMQARQELQ